MSTILTPMRGCADTACGHFRELVLTDPLTKNLAQIRCNTKASAGCIQAELVHNVDPMTRLL